MRIGTIRALATAGALVAGAWASAEQSPQHLQDEVRALQDKVAALEAKQASNSKDLAAAIDSMLRDAEKRSQLLATSGGASPGYDNGFFIATDDKAFLFHPWLQFAPRYVVNWRQQAKATGSDSTDEGFEIRRMKFGFDGNLFSRDLFYTIIWGTDRNTGLPILEEAWVRYMFADEWGVRVGEFKDPVAHEGFSSSKKILAVERSYLQDIIGRGDNFVQGVTAIYQGTNIPLRAEAGFTDGQGSANTDFQNNIPSGSTTVHNDFGVVGRVEYKVMGDWKSYEDFTAMGTKQDLLVFGLAGDWTEMGGTDVLLHTADVQYKNPNGLALYGAFLGRYIRDGVTPGGSRDNFYDWGALGEVAYLFDQHWEVFGRYDYTGLDESALSSGSNGNVHEITAGMNYYFHGHACKVTADVTYLPNGAPKADTGSDVLLSNDKDEFLFRMQFQLLI